MCRKLLLFFCTISTKTETYFLCMQRVINIEIRSEKKYNDYIDNSSGYFNYLSNLFK